jgi:hypothetical protein
MGIQIVRINTEGTTTQWTGSSGTPETDAHTNDGNATYIYTSSTGQVHEFSYDSDALPSGQMVMAVRLVAVAASTVADDTLKLSVRRGTLSTDRRSSLPFDSEFSVSTAYTEYGIYLCNKPAPAIHARTDAWDADGTEWNDYEFGVTSGSTVDGELRVTELRLDIYYRPTTTLDALLTDDNAETFQWLEIEGIRWVPTDRTQLHSEWSVGSYYYGIDHRPVAGTMSTNQAFRSGRINHAKGREEFETARVVLLDVQETAYEGDADGGDPPLTIKRQGFYSWLLAYGDRTNITNTRMTDSTGSGYNQEKGLDPLGWGGQYGRRFTVASTTGFPAAAGEDSYLYVGRECIHYTTSDATSFGDHTDETDLLRGRFGSMNSLHEYNASTGVYPLVADHPVSWNGRWVRWWLNAIDPITGLPFPRSTAVARTYLWGSHTQEIGPGANRYAVQLGAFEQILAGKIPATNIARANRIYIEYGAMFIRAIDNVLNKKATIQFHSLGYDDLDDLLNDATNGLNAKFSGLFSGDSFTGAATLNDVISLSFRIDGYTIYIGFNEVMGKVLGFESGKWIAHNSPSGYVSNPPDKGEEQLFTAKNPPAETFVGARSTRCYVEDDETDSWPALGTVTGTSDEIVAIANSGDDQEYFRFFGAVANDADGDYLSLWPTTPKWWKPYLGQVHTRKSLASTEGGGPITFKLGLACAPLRAHEFMLRAMLSTGFGLNNGTYDLWPKGFGLGINYNLVNAASFKTIGEQLKLWRLYTVLTPTSVKELMEEELQFPNGIMLTQDEQGRLQWSFNAFPTTSDDPAEILQEHWIAGSSVSQEHSARHIVNRYVVEIDYNPIEDKYMTKLDAREPNSIARYGLKEVTSKHRGVRTDMAGGKVVSATSPHTAFPNLCQLRFRRFGFEMATVKGTIGPRGLALLPGQGVKVTQDEIQDTRDQTATGIEDRGCEVEKIDKDDATGQCQVELMYDSVAKKFGGYAPAAYIESWAPNTATVSANRFTDSGDGVTDASLFAVGDKVYVVEGNDTGADVSAVVAISAISGNDISFAAAPLAGIGEGYYIIWAPYDDLLSAQTAKGYVAIEDGGYVDSGDGVEGWDYGI